MKKILILLFLQSLTQSVCHKGCLRCNALDKCQLCDYINGYIFKDYSCQQITIKNCLLISYLGQCLQCEENFYQDTSNNKCLQLIEEEKIPNCRIHFSKQKCLYCQPKFYNYDGKCYKTETPVPNCLVQFNNNQCTECDQGFVLVYPSQTSCKILKKVENCQVYSSLGCSICEEGKIFQTDNYQTSLIQEFQNQDVIYTSNIYDIIRQKFIKINNTCIFPIVQNCKNHLNTFECLECNTGYYVENKKCFRFPQSSIPFCEYYASSEECKSCKQGYYLKNSRFCDEVKPILNCLLYQSDANEVICQQCNRAYYLDQNICLQRNIFVDKCLDYSINYDNCAKCIEYYQPTSDKKKCLPQITDCIEYKTYNQQYVYLECGKCKDFYYFDPFYRFCKKGEDINCQNYEVDQIICKKCRNGYYLKNGQCLKQTLINNCDIYDNEQFSVCNQCSQESWKFMKLNYCETVNIENCEVYSSITTCSKCQERYNLVDGKYCELMKPTSYCLESINNICSKCENGYLLQNGFCLDSFQQLKKNCYELQGDGNVSQFLNLNCKSCDVNNFPLELENNYACVQEQEIQLLGNIIKNCRSYSYENGSLKCEFCEEGFFKENNICVLQCTSPNKIKRIVYEKTINSFVLKDLNVCDTQYTDCEIQTIKKDPSNNFTQTCSVYPNSILKVLFNDKSRVVFPVDIEEQTQSKNIYLLPEYQTMNLTNLNLKRGQIKDDKILNCKSYYDLPESEHGCIQCKFGFYGKITNWKVDYCHQYNIPNMKCQICMDGYRLANSDMKCEKIPEVDGCENFSLNSDGKCQICKKNFYHLLDGTCRRNTVQNCLIISKTANECQYCYKEYLLSNDKTQCVKKIDKCIEQNNTSPFACTKCEDYYYVNASKNCSEGSVPYCWQYDQTQINTCIKYQKRFTYYEKHKCVDWDKIDGCVEQSTETICTKCNEKNYYLTNSKCCEYGKYFNGTSCQDMTIENCRTNTTQSNQTCTQCEEYYNKYTNTTTSTDVCCSPKNYFYNSKCQQMLNLTESTDGCLLLDKSNKYCLKCPNNKYLSELGAQCCDNGKYYDNSTKTCKDITQVTNCLELNSLTSLCKKCKLKDDSNNDIQDGPHCCLKTQYYKTSACASIETDFKCTQIDDNQKCIKDTCSSDYYWYDGRCCKETLATIEYNNSGTCTTLITGDKIANCIQYNENKKCIKCSTDKYPNSTGEFCCETGTYFVNNTCLSQTYLTHTCKEFNYQNFDTTPCSKCKDDFYLSNKICIADGTTYASLTSQPAISNTDYPNCIQITSSSATTCQKCKKDYYKVDSTKPKVCCKSGNVVESDNCVDRYNIVKSCFRVKKSDLTCSQTTQFQLGSCLSHFVTQYSFDDIHCCQLGYEYDSTNLNCKKIVLANCIGKKPTDSTCKICKIGYYDNSGTCTAYTTGITQINNSGEAIKCQENYFLQGTTCVTKTGNCTSLNENCIEIDNTTDCNCLKCKKFYQYGNNCQTKNYFIDNNTYYSHKDCSEYIKDGTVKCNKCFYDSNEWTDINTEFTLKYLNHLPSFNLVKGQLTDIKISIDASFNYNYKDSNDNCCSQGYYFNNNQCVKITQENCVKLDNASKCAQCFDSYTYHSTPDLCCLDQEDLTNNKCVTNPSKACPGGKYLSNNHCCETGKYWNNTTKKCLKLFDTNCEQSSSNQTCSQCASGYHLEDSFLIKVSYQTINGIQSLIIKGCLKDEYKLDTYYKGRDVEQALYGCIKFNKTNMECDTCSDDFHLKNGHCCPKGKIHIKNDQIKQCVDYNYIIENCSNFENSSNKCLNCDDGYYLTDGICCQEGTFYNKNLMTCEKFLNCQQADNDLKQCEICKKGYYLFDKKNCCQINQYYNYEQQKCLTISENQCEKMNVALICTQCSNGFYLTENKKCCEYSSKYDYITNSCIYQSDGCLEFQNGKCVKYESNLYYNTEQNTICQHGTFASAQGMCIYLSDYSTCLEMNKLGECIKCTANKTLTNGVCCEINESGNLLNFSCSPNKNRFCSKQKNNFCTECITGYYLSKQICVPEGKYMDIIGNQIATIDAALTDCSQVKDEDSTVCQRCNSPKFLKTSVPECQDVPESKNCISGYSCICKEGFYLLSSTKCVTYGYYLDGGGSEVLYSSNTTEQNNCKTTFSSSSDMCLICYGTAGGNYYLSNGQCVLQGKIFATTEKDISTDTLTEGFKNCLQAIDTTSCLYCKKNFKNESENSKTCIASTAYYSKTCYLDHQQVCMQCINSTDYLTNKRCCPKGMIYDITLKKCIVIGSGIIPTTLTITSNCVKEVNNICVECSNGLILFNNFCCDANKILYDGTCQTISNDITSLNFPSPSVFTDFELNYCQKVDESDLASPKCVKNTDNEWRTSSCQQGSTTFYTYFINDHCCPEYYYYKIDTKKCELISTYNAALKYKYCGRINETGFCESCGKNAYFSSDICCPIGKFYDSSDQTDCKTNTINLCQKQEGNKCLSFSQEINEFGCTGTQFRDHTTGLCENIPLNCEFAEKKDYCWICKDGYYVNKGKCILNGKYLDAGNVLQDVSTLSIDSCIAYDLTTTSCLKCSGNKLARFGKCCLDYQLWNPTMSKCIMKDIYGQNCLQLGTNNYCNECEENYYLVDGVCVKENKVFNPSAYKIQDMVQDTYLYNNRCKKMKLNTCIDCKDEFSTVTYTSGTTKYLCCLKGFTKNTSSEQCSSVLKVENCQRFTDQTCSECSNGYFLSNGICCPDETFNYNGKCIKHQDFMVDCDVYDVVNRQCMNCNNSKYLSNGFCCIEGKYYDTEKLECVSIPDKYNCLKLNNSKCEKCQANANLYLLNDNCCLLGEHWNSNIKQCYKNKNYFCKKYDFQNSKCLECKTDFYLYDGNCCEDGKVWKDGECKYQIKNCKTYEENLSTIKCKTCQTSYLLALEQNICCPQNSIILNNECIPQTEFYYTAIFEGCTDYDPTTRECKSCEFGKYLSNNVCVDLGKYYNPTTKTIVTILGSLTNCNKYDTVTSKCSGCESTHYLNSSKDCIQIFANCLEMSTSTNKCTKCEQNYYLTMGNCCKYGYQWVTNQCVYKLSTTNCLYYNSTDNNLCENCQKGYHLVDFTSLKYCCQDGYYCNNSQVQTIGTIKNCKVYETNENTCKICLEQYAIFEKLTDVGASTKIKSCQPIAISKCQENELIAENYQTKEENILTCKQCNQKMKIQVLSTYNKFEVFAQTKIIQFCEKFDQQYLLKDSSFKCLGCKQGYYLDNQTCIARTKYEQTANCYGRFEEDKDYCLKCQEGFYYNNQTNTCVENSDCILYQDTCIVKNPKIYYSVAAFTTSVSISFVKIIDYIRYKTESFQGIYPAYIDKCLKHDSCQNKFLNGIPSNIQRYLSCHICKDSTMIPFISLYLNTTGTIVEKGLQRYSIFNTTDNLNTYQEDRGNYTNQCFSKDASDFNVFGTFPANCGIGIVLPFIDNRASNQDIWCSVCAPGYRPVLDANGWKINSCDQIENCEKFGNSFNECDKCEKNHAFRYDTKINRQYCVNGQDKVENCQAVNINGNCELCEENYILTSKGYCEELKMQYCEEFGHYITSSLQPLLWNEILNKKMMPGCKKCQEGYLGLKMSQSKYFCVFSSSIENMKVDRVDYLIEYCQIYKIFNGSIICDICRNDRIKTTTNTCIIIGANHKNCQTALDSQNCDTCNSGFLLKDGGCYEYKISHCLTKDPSDPTICSSCQDFYYMKDKECLQGTIEFCQKYTGVNKCSQCVDKYQLLVLNDRQYCLPINTFDNCEEFNMNQLQISNELKCTKCQKGYFPNDLTIQINVCNNINIVKNCIKYQKSFNLSTSTLVCIECAQGYYLQENKCILDLFIIPFCKGKLTNTKQCENCFDGYYLSDNKLECIINPDGIQYCIEYTSKDKCTLCRPFYYLKDSKCEEVPVQKRILNCKYYKDEETCSKCIDYLFLEGNECKEGLVEFCQEYINIRSCRICQNGYAAIDQGENQICVIKPEIQNCLQVSDETPFQCVQCRQQYYPIEDKCFGVPQDKIIQNCLIQKNDNECRQCEQDYVLSLDNKNCYQILVDNNCQAIEENKEGVCVLCKQGYKLKQDGSCIEIDWEEGCWIYDSENKKCIVCRQGYYMQSDLLCHKQ